MQSRELPQLDDLYKEIILDHYRKPYGRVPVERIDYKAEGMNPLCGDEVNLCLQVKGQKIEKVHLEAHGCSISVASSSMLADILKGKTLEEAKSISKHLKDIMHGKTNSHVIARSGSDEAISFREASGDCFARLAPRAERVRAKALPRNDKVKPDIGDLEALEGVKKFPVRIKCALLPWTTLEEALVGHEHVEIS